jgi:hypothetical protein
MLFGCVQLVSNIKNLAVSNMRRHEVNKVLEDIVGDEWLQEEWNASFWDSEEQILADPALTPTPSSVHAASLERNPFLMRAAPLRVPSPLKPSPFIDGIVVGALTTLNARVVALLLSPDCSWLIAVSGCGDVMVYDCIGLLDEAFVAPFVLHLHCEVHSASTVLLSNSHPCVGFVAVGGDKGFIHIIAIEVVRADLATRSRSMSVGAGNSSRRTDIVSYKLNHVCTLSMECDSGRIMSICAVASTRQLSSNHAAGAVGSDRNPSSWHLLSYCTGKSHIAHWGMHAAAAPHFVASPKPPRRIELDRVWGGVQSMAASPCGLWIAAGTSRGFVCICDLRFSVLVKKIYTGSDTVLTSVAVCTAPPVSADASDDGVTPRMGKAGWFGGRASSKLGLLSPPGIPMNSSTVGGDSAGDDKGPRMWVVVPSGGAGGDSVSAHNVSTGCCDAKFEITRGHVSGSENRSGSSSSGISMSATGVHSSNDLVSDRYATRLLQSQSVLPSVRAITVASYVDNFISGGMFTAGSDRHLRYWSFAHPEHCSCSLLPPLASHGHSEIFAYRCENGCALFSSQPQDDSERGEASSMQQKYRKGLDALAQSSVGDLVGVTAVCMIGR